MASKSPEEYDKTLIHWPKNVNIFGTAVAVGGQGFHSTEVLDKGGNEALVLLLKVSISQLDSL